MFIDSQCYWTTLSQASLASSPDEVFIVVAPLTTHHSRHLPSVGRLLCVTALPVSAQVTPKPNSLNTFGCWSVTFAHLWACEEEISKPRGQRRWYVEAGASVRAFSWTRLASRTGQCRCFCKAVTRVSQPASVAMWPAQYLGLDKEIRPQGISRHSRGGVLTLWTHVLSSAYKRMMSISWTKRQRRHRASGSRLLRPAGVPKGTAPRRAKVQTIGCSAEAPNEIGLIVVTSLPPTSPTQQFGTAVQQRRTASHKHILRHSINQGLQQLSKLPVAGKLIQGMVSRMWTPQPSQNAACRMSTKALPA